MPPRDEKPIIRLQVATKKALDAIEKLSFAITLKCLVCMHNERKAIN